MNYYMPTITFSRNRYDNTVRGDGWAQRSMLSNNTKAQRFNYWNTVMDAKCAIGTRTVCEVNVYTIAPEASDLKAANSSACNSTQCSVEVNNLLSKSTFAR